MFQTVKPRARKTRDGLWMVHSELHGVVASTFEAALRLYHACVLYDQTSRIFA